jgi:hypothetical protein
MATAPMKRGNLRRDRLAVSNSDDGGGVPVDLVAKSHEHLVSCYVNFDRIHLCKYESQK